MDETLHKSSLFRDVFSSNNKKEIFFPDSNAIRSVDRAARCIYQALEYVGQNLRSGMTTKTVFYAIEEVLKFENVDPGMIIRISPDEVVWHGIPDARILRSGEIVSIDIACSVNGWWADCAMSFPIGEIDAKRSNLLKNAAEVVRSIVPLMRAGYKGHQNRIILNEISSTNDVCIISSAAGHGIGRHLHEDPLLPYDGKTHESLLAGFLYTVEPIVTSGNGIVEVRTDGSAITTDGEPSAHFEVTVLSLKHGAHVMGAPIWF